MAYLNEDDWSMNLQGKKQNFWTDADEWGKIFWFFAFQVWKTFLKEGKYDFAFFDEPPFIVVALLEISLKILVANWFENENISNEII